MTGSPSPSGRQEELHPDVSGAYIFVVNKSDDPMSATPAGPNYSRFTSDEAGTPVNGVRFETTLNTSPLNGLVLRDRKILLGTGSIDFILMPPKKIQ